MKQANKHTQFNPARRLAVVAGLWVFLALALVFQVINLQWVQKDFLAHQGDIRNLRVEPLAAHRGVIRDRKGQPLAVSTPVYTLWANPKEVLESRESWRLLAGNSIITQARFAELVNRHSRREFIYLARGLSPEQAQSVLQLNIPGVYSMTEYRRFYPAGEVASHIVGFNNIDDRGQEGIELAREADLQGVSGRKKVLRDLRGRVIQDIEVLAPARVGQDITLSIDMRLQYLAYKELLQAVRRFNAEGGSVVVLDSWTGEVLAMVNQPAYNPNNRRQMTPQGLRNRAVTDLFEPGSTMKPFTIGAAMEMGMVSPATTVDTRPGTMRVGSATIRDLRNYGIIDLTTVLTQSSNVGTTKLALAMEEQALPNFIERFGFGAATGSGFPGESSGVMPIRSRWRDIELATLSYGYGMSVTALQLARAYGVLANDGVKLPVTFEKTDVPPEGERVLATEVARTMVDMLENVVHEGSARRAAVPGFSVAGKTGTVHKAIAGGYAEDRYMGLFAGIAPANSPRYVGVVVIDDPRGGDYFGGLVSAPVFSNIMAGLLRYRQISPDVVDGYFATVIDDMGGVP